MIIYKSYNLCIGDAVTENISTGNAGLIFNFQDVPTYVQTSGGFNGSYFISAETVGQDSFTFQETFQTINDDGDLVSVTLTYQVNILVANCVETTFENCCDNVCNIVWLNREGGWQNYIFTGIKTFEVRQDKPTQYMEFMNVRKYAERKNVFEGVVCTTGNVPKSHVDYLDSLRYSIQAFLFNTVTEEWDIPIAIDSESWVKYNTKDKLFDIRISYIKAKEVKIQSQ